VRTRKVIRDALRFGWRFDNPEAHGGDWRYVMTDDPGCCVTVGDSTKDVARNLVSFQKIYERDALGPRHAR
jgi:hypothetical protein